jgi:hypothetical protein
VKRQGGGRYAENIGTRPAAGKHGGVRHRQSGWQGLTGEAGCAHLSVMIEERSMPARAVVRARRRRDATGPRR